MVVTGYVVDDTVHGKMALSRLTKAMVSTPHLQRLRLIHQLGILHCVYPCADGTRFIHSLG
jgi:hypothetical protein